MVTRSAIALPGYHVTEQLYAGSRTLVYRAVREADQQPVVIKLLKNEHPSFSELVQFRNQYTIAKNLDIPGIIKPYSLEPYGNGYALVMEDFGGRSLRHFANERSLSVEQFWSLALQLVDILHPLHQQRVIHKDIKPANILIQPETMQVKLIDFSISSLLPRETQEIQNPNVLEGTLAYLSPEQTGRMNRGIDYRSDFYSLGVTFFELLTGQLPFQSNDPMEVVHCHIAKQPPSLCNLNLELPLMLGEITRKLMAKNAEDRYQSALGLKHDLVKCQEQWQTTAQSAWFELGARDVCDRFLIPETLYGRQSEVQMLLDAFERVSQGSTEAMLVAGFSGIGKTAVVNEVHKPIVRQRGYFITGKFDQFQRNIPLSAFVQAFRGLMGQLLSESDTQLKQWKITILAALGENAQVIIDVIPELEQIIGSQPPVLQLAGSAAQNRFERLLQQFIQVFTTPAHPLVIFIDDLQWADSASLNLMRSLMGEANTHYLLFIGAYRDNEVTLAHPLILNLDEMHKSGATVNTMTLAPLTQASVNQLVADTLSCSLTLAAPLTASIVDKTGGNPFFTIQFLKALYDDRLIAFNGDENYWECDIAQVRSASQPPTASLTLTDDVVAFMATQLQKLPAPTQAVLKLAACIGNQFDLSTLAIVLEQTEAETAAVLWKALQEGLVIPQSEVYKFYQDAALRTPQSAPHTPHQCSYKFLHDRVQQAAYSLIPDEQKQSTHLTIGQLLLQESSETQRQERIFDIVGHFNFARGLICDRTARYELASLNLQAGKAAKASAAFEAALIFVNTGIHSLPADSWQEQYPLTLALHNLAAEAAYLCSQFEQVEQLITAILQQANRLLDKISAYEIQILAYLAQSQPQDAIDTALNVLGQLGIRLPKKPTQPEVLLGLAKTKLILGNKKPEQLVNLPNMTDANKLAAMEILSTAASAAYICAPKLMPLLVFERVNLSVRYGNTSLSAFAYAWYGLILCGIVMDIEAGYQFGQLALQLLERFNATDLRAKTLFMTYTFVSHWRDRITDTMPALLTAYQSGLETGDLEYAAWAALVHSYNRYWTGQNLTEAEAAIRSLITAIAPFNQKNASLYIQTYHQATLNLLGHSSDPSCLSGESYQVAKDIPVQVAANDRTGLFFSYVCQQHLHYLFGQYAEAVEKSNAARPYFDNCVSSLPTVLHYFYDSLAQLAIYTDATSPERKQILKCIQANQKKLKKWAHHAPMNYQHKFFLVEAERCRVLGNQGEAIDLYDRAIALANEHEYLNEAALANELAARFYLNWGKERLAQEYMTDAYYGYARWGAKAKIVDLETRYTQLLAPILQQSHSPLSVDETVCASATVTSTSSSSSISDSLDLAAILKASQTLSSEIELGKLLSTLLQLVIKNAGADKCVLLLQDNRLFVRGLATVEAKSVVLQRTPVEESQDIPLKLIYSVKNRLEPVVLMDATTQTEFVGDPYFVRQQPKSILCSPILHQGKLLGIVYLENNLTLGAFTSDRVHILNLLCAQATISLENARLYQEVQQALEDARLMQFSIDRVVTPVCWVESDARFSYANDAFCRDVGYSREEVVGKYVYDLNPDFSKEGWSEYWRSIQQHAWATFESRLYNSEGICHPVEITINHITFHEKEYHLTFIVNISDRKRAESAILQKSQELEQALQALQHAQLQIVQSEKMSALGNLVAGVAHEINNPVGFIAGNLQPALDYVKDTFGLLDLYQQEYPHPSAAIQEEMQAIDLEYVREDLPKLIGSMKLGVDRIRGISDSLRTFSRADKDYKVPFNIHDGINSTILILKHRFKANGTRPEIEVVTNYGNIPIVECFPGQLNQVFMNILANAIDALEEVSQKRTFKDIVANPNRIEIQTRLDDSLKRVIIHIRDNGMGMSDEVKQRVFDHLFTTKAVGKGTGLGLAIARQIVESTHSGKLSFHSIRGKGTEFLIEIPV